MTFKEKLTALYEAIEYVGKGGHNEKQNYDYVKATDVVKAFRKAAIDLKLYAEINFDFVGGPFTIARAKDVNAPFAAVNVKCSGVLYDLESDGSKTFSGLGTAADTGDKATYKAQTGALKYALKHAALIPDESAVDPEADESVDEAPDFQDARHAAPQVVKTKPVHVPAKAEPIQQAPAPAVLPKAEIAAPTPIQPPPVASNTASSGDVLPTEEQMNEYRSRFSKLGDQLSVAGLKASARKPINRKIVAYMMSQQKVEHPSKATVNQWDSFFAHVENVKAQQSVNALADLIEKANQ